MPSHKPRRRRKEDDYEDYSQGKEIAVAEDGLKTPSFPLSAFLWPAKGNVSQWVVLPVILLFVGLFRWAAGFWPYSGFQSPPMYGDFEAQRHWLEITTGLPVSQWYFHDLEWWGLDYPPLTAYHSWLLGKIGKLVNPAWFELYQSRGLESNDLKIFMRATVLASEYLTYIPAVVVLLRRFARTQRVSRWETYVTIVAVLMQPATILIDHAHFQYNTVMLGFAAASLACLMNNSPLWACFYFVCTIGFKQMALFYAPAIFAYLLGICVYPRINIGRFISIAFITVISFALLFAPLLLSTLSEHQKGITPGTYSQPPLLASLPFEIPESAWYHPLALQLAQSIHRIFPFARGLFEDKVANLWCALHTFHKLNVYPQGVVQKAALAATSLAILPPCLILFLRPRKDLLFPGFATVAWAFFLCSYQVHEKNVLLPLLPTTLMLARKGGFLPTTRAWVGLANILGCWTMYPLLAREGLRVPYFVLTLLWAYLLGLPPTSLEVFRRSGAGAVDIFTATLHALLYLAMGAWHVGEAFVAPPFDKPDLWVVVNVLVGAAGFGLCYLGCLLTLVARSGLVGGQGKAKTQ